MKTYKVEVQAYALRTITVRADSAEEAMNTAIGRIRDVCGPWVIDFPGSSDEHFTVVDAATDRAVGPWGDGRFDDSPENDDEADE